MITVLVGFGAFTVALIAALVLWILKGKSFRHPNPNPANLIAGLLVCAAVAALMSFLLFNAFAHEEAYGIGSRDTGRLYSRVQDPVSFWFLAVVYYVYAVAAWSYGLVLAVKLKQSLR